MREWKAILDGIFWIIISVTVVWPFTQTAFSEGLSTEMKLAISSFFILSLLGGLRLLVEGVIDDDY